MNALQCTIHHHPASIFCTIELKGQLKSTDAIKLKEQLCGNIDQFGKVITIDLSGIEELDLTGLNSLVISKQTFSREGKILKLRVPENGPLNEFASLTKFEQFLNIA